MILEPGRFLVETAFRLANDETKRSTKDSHIWRASRYSYQLSGIAVPSRISDSLRERPETIWRPLERSLGPAGNEYRLAGLLRWWLVVRGWPRCFIGVGCPRSEWFAVCQCKIVFNNRNSAAGGAAPSEEQTTMGRVVPPHFAP
jgi:hypothetical protein